MKRIFGLIIIGLILLSACADKGALSFLEDSSLLTLKPDRETPSSSIKPTETLSGNSELVATNRPKETPTAMAVPTPTIKICSETEGELKHLEISAVGFNEPLQFYLYLPPCYSDSASVPYPVVYLLHGQTYTDEQWVRLGVPETMNRLIIAEEISPYVIVMPYETQAFYNRYSTALTRSLIPWIEAEYNVCNRKECRAIGGISRGGGWALYTVFQMPDWFGHLGMHSTPTFDGEQGRIRSSLRTLSITDLPRIYMDIGSSDYWYPDAYSMKEFFDVNAVPHEWIENPGKHDETYWESHLEEYLRWYGEGFK